MNAITIHSRNTKRIKKYVTSTRNVSPYRYNKNVTYKNFNNERAIQWHLVIEEFGPELKIYKR